MLQIPNNLDKFPVLFDVTLNGKLIKKGFYNYDLDRFDIPMNKLSIIKQHFPDDFRIIESTGYVTDPQ